MAHVRFRADEGDVLGVNDGVFLDAEDGADEGVLFFGVRNPYGKQFPSSNPHSNVL